MKFEKEKERAARELGESEQLGYDIESTFESEVRHIEVKGSEFPRADIFLSSNEFKALSDKKDTYFLYAVGNALSVPRLHVIKGSRVLQSVDPKVIIQGSQWKRLVEEEA